MKFVAFLIMFGAGFLLTSSCQQSSSDNSGNAVSIYSSQFYFKQISLLTIDVVYESGAEPYVGTTTAGLNYWDITIQNLQALFNGRAVSFVVPKTLAEMRLIPSQSHTTWTVAKAIELAKQYRNGDSAGSSGKIFVGFVKGYAANDDGTANPNIIGFSVTGSNVILIFKQVVQNSGASPNGPVPKFVEQSTIVHEIAHSVGFVNNGLPLTSSHHDSSHGAHCTNPNCVMYYQNEGKDNLSAFIDKFKDSQTAVMFDDACINDAKSF